MNTEIIKLLVVKDWQLFQKPLAAYVLAGMVALCLLGLAKPWSFYLGSLTLIVVMVAAACSAISNSLMVERKDQTLAFVMSLPVSPVEFTLAKLAGNLLNFGVPFGITVVGTLLLVVFTPLPDGLFVYALLMFVYIFFAYSISLSMVMALESEGWATFAMIGPMVLINPYIMGLSQISAIQSTVGKDAIVWSAPALAILGSLLGLGVLILALTTRHHARKPAFY